MLTKKDSLEYLKSKKDFEFDINYSDPPYALGSEVIIREDGKVDYKKANDFMNKWEMPTGEYWEQWFKEAFRTLKYGGYLIMFGMDRQLLLFKYYARLAGFEEQQSLYWYFISNFPKATDLSNMIAKRDGAKRDGAGSQGNTFPIKNTYQEYTKTDLAKKYEGYKYSISPLKQTNETIMVFKKPYKTGSCLHDTIAYENGDNECRCGAFNIDGNRVETSDNLFRQPCENGSIYSMTEKKINTGTMSDAYLEGRYPSQTFCDSNTAEVLGESSKILHTCDFENKEHDLYFYQPKVSKKERNAGCDGFEEKPHNDRKENGKSIVEVSNKMMKNNHPTLKPIKLNERILRLFKTPNEDKIVYPFAGSGSEIIGGIKAGFKNWCGCEINQEYVDIAKARIEYWKDKTIDEVKNSKVEEIEEVSKDQANIFDFIDEKENK